MMLRRGSALGRTVDDTSLVSENAKAAQKHQGNVSQCGVRQ